MALKRSRTKSLTTENVEPIEEPKQVEVAAQITLPPDGGWGWVVVTSSFLISAITDGVVVSFGCMYSRLLSDLNLNPSLISLVNSLTVASSFCFGPVVSALINRFGFRLCVMIGSIISAVACCLTFIFGDYTSLLFFYGLLSGFGFAMMNMGCLLVVGFYFQKWRAIAFTIAITGSSIGVIIFSLIYTETSQRIGWQYTILLQASLTGLCYFFAFAYRPLLSMTVVQTTILKSDTTDDQLRSISMLNSKSAPMLSKVMLKGSETSRRMSLDEEVKTEGLFLADTNVQFPTAAEVIHEIAEEVHAEASVPRLASNIDYVSRLTVIPNNAPYHETELEELRALFAEAISNVNVKEGDTAPAVKSTIAISILPHEETVGEGNVDGTRTESVKGIFHWEEHVTESRPLYRDDAFLHHTTQPDHEQIVENPIEYQLKVSRVAAAADLKERRGIFTTAFKRVLATMLHPKFLKRKSFISICLCFLLYYAGYLIPLIFVTDRGKDFRISMEMRKWFISAIGLSGIFGRFFVSFLVAKISPMKIVIVSHFIAGVTTVGSCFLPAAECQIGYCLIFGMTTSGASIMRSMIIVRLYGLENLTNCTGMVFLFQGVGCLISPPLAGFLLNVHEIAPFTYAGACLIGSALLLIPVSMLVDHENKAGTRADTKTEEKQEEKRPDTMEFDTFNNTQEDKKALAQLVEIKLSDTAVIDNNPGTKAILKL